MKARNVTIHAAALVLGRHSARIPAPQPAGRVAKVRPKPQGGVLPAIFPALTFWLST